MDLKLHANATTTPRTRAYIQQSPASVAELAAELGVSESTIRRWRKRTSVTDRSHRPLRLARLSLSPIEEQLIVELRTRAHLPLDDIVEVMRRCINDRLSRSAIHRCLQRHGVSRLAEPQAAPPHQRFEPVPFGYVHIDLKHLARLKGRPAYVFVAIERLTRFVHVEIVTRRDAATIAACLERFLAAFGHPVHTILTDNGSEFTDRFAVDMKGKPEGRPSGQHPFDKVCADNAIRHKLTRPYHPQTNGMAERFNRRLAQALRQAPPSRTNTGKNRFNTHDERNRFIELFVDAYNHTRLKCLGYIAPLQDLNNQVGHNTKAGATTVERSGGSAIAPALPLRELIRRIPYETRRMRGERKMSASENTAAKSDDARVHSVTPHLVCDGAAAAIDFYRWAFGAVEAMRLDTDDGKVMHACLRINGSSVMLVDEFPGMGAVGPVSLGGSSVTIHLAVDDADSWVARAEAAGAVVTMPVAEMFWGDRYGVVRDPFGHQWSLGTPVRQLSEAEIREAARRAIPEDAATS